MIVILGLNINFGHAALTAKTANVIQGNAPEFIDNSAKDRLGFTVGGKFYSESSSDSTTTGNITESTVNKFALGLRLDEFAIKQLVATDFTVSSDYSDSDGDGAATVPFTMGTVSYEWRENGGALISSTDYGKTLGCGSGLSMPLTLKITLPNVQVHSEYGLPKDSAVTQLEKTYQITTASGICFAKPYQMEAYPTYTWYGVNSADNYTSWNDTANTAKHSQNGGDYDATVFDPTNGFKAGAATKFPTTGFANAKFQLIMTGSQTDYNYSVTATPSSSVSVDTNGYVTLISKPSGNVTVTTELKSDTSVKHHYIFNPTTVWAIPKSGKGTYAWATSQCGSALNILTRAELTNSPRNTALTGWSYVENSYTRAIGGGVFGEWGYTSSNRYPGSLWVFNNYWTRDVYSTGTGSSQFVIYSNAGKVNYRTIGSTGSVACRG